MSVSDFLQEKARAFTTFTDPGEYELRTIEVDKSGHPLMQDHGPDSLKGQLEKMSSISQPEASKGSLHILLHQWRAGMSFNAGLPFKDAEALDLVIEGLRLPRCYPYDYGRWQHVPARTTFLEDGIEIVCHTPKFESTWASLALWYDFGTRTSSCFFAVTEGEMGAVLDVMASLKSLASHPFFIPVALYWVCSQILRRDVEDVHKKMKKVQVDTGLLKKYLKVDHSQASEHKQSRAERGPSLTDIHQVIVEQHALLTRGIAEFTEQLGTSCAKGLDSLESLGSEDDQGLPILPSWLDEDAHLELRKLLTHTENSTIYELGHRAQMLSRIQIQQQVLYNLMQSRIGDETLRDSSAMKSIAVLTMVFLPSTAVATILSMDAFFGQTTADGQIIVSSKFWIFWAIAIPITLVVLLCYFVWVERAWLAELWLRRKGHDVEAQVQGLTGQGEKKKELFETKSK